jgi:S1-C subfamily serine protease
MLERPKTTVILAALIGGSLIAPCATASEPAERAFQAASNWTVYIRAAIDVALDDDEQGTHSGSGLVVDARRGWVLTNAHVASHSYSTLAVSFRRGRPLPAERIYVDPYLDVAVIAYDPKSVNGLPPEPVLDCDSVPPVGHPVGAFGHPWGLKFTGTRGIASAVTSRLGPDMLQTDAPINAGNSGGPLISLDTGHIVGLSTAKISDESVEGLSFAVPMPNVCRILALLREGRDPSPPDLPVEFAYDEGGERTLTVVHVRDQTGTLKLAPGDRIIALGEPADPVETHGELMNALRGTLDDVVMHVERDGREVVLRGSLPAVPLLTQRRAFGIAGAFFAESDRSRLAPLVGEGRLMVHHVDPASEADQLAVRSYDVLVSANGEDVDSIDDLATIARRAEREQRDLELVLVRLFDHNIDELITYHRRVLSPSGLTPVGPW